MAEGEIDNLTMEQYLALTRGNQAPGVVKPEIEGNANFEIKSQFIHQKVNIFYNGLRTMNRQLLDSQGPIPGMTPAQALTAIHTMADHSQNSTPSGIPLRRCDFGGVTTVYQAWERYNDLLYECPTHDINSHQKVNIFYNGLGTMNRQLLDSQGPIPGMTPAQALTAIQTMVDHSQKWHDGTSSKNIEGSSNSEGIAAIVNKLENLGRDMKKLKENVHAIQVGCQICRGAHLDKDCPLNEEVKSVEESTETSREAHDKIIQGLETKVKTLANEVEGRVNNGKFKECKTICTEDGSPLYTPFYYSSEEIEYFSSNSGFSDNEKQETDNSGMDLVENKPRTEEDEEIRMNPRCSALLQNHLPPKEQDPGSFILPCSIGKLDFNNALADLGASISVMPLSMYKRLGIGKLKPINMVIKMADNTKCTPKGIVENLLIKIDKFIFPVDFVILDMVEDLRMPIILGRPLLATAHAKVDIFRKSISLEVGSEKESYEEIVYRITEEKQSRPKERRDVCDGGDSPINKMKCYWESMNDSKQEELERVNLSLNDWIKIRDEEDDLEENLEDPEECEEDKANAIMWAIHDKLKDDWFNNTSKDEVNLERILDYLEPRSYNGFINLDNETYNKRRRDLHEVTKELMDALPLGRENWSRFKDMIRSIYKEVEFEVSSTRETSLLYRRVARFHLLQLSFEEESNAQGSLLF
ncbi:zinc knuckle CX2CX4HX4C containing protein [Tanacetum coccineum]